MLAWSLSGSPPIHICLQKGPLDLIETGQGLKVQTDKPHLVSLGSGRLSTAITLLPLEEGERAVSWQGKAPPRMHSCPGGWASGGPSACLVPASPDGPALFGR